MSASQRVSRGFHRLVMGPWMFVLVVLATATAHAAEFGSVDRISNLRGCTTLCGAGLPSQPYPRPRGTDLNFPAFINYTGHDSLTMLGHVSRHWPTPLY